MRKSRKLLLQLKPALSKRSAKYTACWQRIWQQRGIAAQLLLAFSACFALLSAVRRVLYRWHLLRTITLPVPVVVVGNIMVGGVGKTPLVIALIAQLRAHGWLPGVVMRGYGSTVQHQAICRVQGQDAARYGDEAVLIARHTQAPVFVGTNRVAAAQQLLSDCPEVNVIVSDDGLQHYALARDIEIAVFDERGCGNGWLLPAGPLREPLSRLQKVDAIVVNGAHRPQFLEAIHRPLTHMRLQAGFAYRLANPGEQQPLEWFRQQTILAIAGIGHPPRFFKMLEQAGLSCTTLALPDHYDYRANPFAQQSAEVILITEKDAVKCANYGYPGSPGYDGRVWVVPVTAHLDGDFVRFILEKLRGSSPA